MRLMCCSRSATRMAGCSCPVWYGDSVPSQWYRGMSRRWLFSAAEPVWFSSTREKLVKKRAPLWLRQPETFSAGVEPFLKERACSGRSHRCRYSPVIGTTWQPSRKRTERKRLRETSRRSRELQVPLRG